MRKTSQTRGVAPWVLPLLLIVLIRPCPLCGQPWAEYADIPDPSRGDIIFYVDIVSFYEGEGRNVEEVYCIVPNDQVTFIEQDGSFAGKLRYTTEIRDGSGEVVGSSESTVDITAESAEDTQDRSVVQVLQSRVSVTPGRYTATVVLEDLNALKRELISFLLKKYRRGEVEVLVDSRDFGKEEFALSDIEFARGLRRTSEGAFQKSGFEIIPNAHRRYGLLLPELAIFFELYDLSEALDYGQVIASYSITNKRGGEIFRSEKSLGIGGDRTASTALFDVTSLSSGSYLLALSVSDTSGKALARSERRFDVAWSPLSWGRHEYEMLGDMEYVLTEEEMITFRTLSPGEQEEFLEEFWNDIDPTPGTIDNEARTEHYRRVSYADRHFGSTHNRGALTDRGRLYIKYGPPDDIQSFYSDYEFVQGTRHIEGAENPVPTDPFSRLGIKTGSGEAGSWDQAGSDADEHADQIGGSTVHGKAYEIWTYDGAGLPVRRLSKRVPSSAKMRFIFVDERGYGEYEIVYSTEKQEY
jgi:GWxTD domain-containing protein